ncbi:unannotated protein [freshwater metagenome]|uniref:Unannotated protein n=1 Tax=freshwater metagenome TaxID=449393 RepID=A0A6J7HUI8_9ZZZZ|nr:D-alanyl-D-alanine carboxypeptidase [Actinomycetota bacterium]
MTFTSRPQSLRLGRGLTALTLASVTAVVSLLLAAGPAAAEPIGGPNLTGYDVIVDPGKQASDVPNVAASTWVLADLDTGAILAAQGPHVQRSPASVLKTLTLLTLVQRLDPATVYTTNVDDVTVDGSRVGIVENAPYSVSDLFHGLVMQSGNDCAHALAMLNGGVETTVSQMNDEAQRIQAYDTVAKTPHGLEAPGQVTSAYDLALISRAGLNRPDFYDYVNTINYEMPGFLPEKEGDPRPTFTIATQNPLFINDYPGAIGVKTGWTDEAGRTFVGAAEQDGHRLIVTLMNVQDDIIDVAAPLLDWGFANEGELTPVGYLVDPVSADATASASAERAGGDSKAPSSAEPTPSGAQTAATPTSSSVSKGWLWGFGAVIVLAFFLIGAGVRVWRKPVPAPRHRR